jgi:hypothetical protein
MPSSVSGESRRRLRGSARLRLRASAGARPTRASSGHPQPSECFPACRELRVARYPTPGLRSRSTTAGRCQASDARRCEDPSAGRCTAADACRCKGSIACRCKTTNACRCKGPIAFRCEGTDACRCNSSDACRCEDPSAGRCKSSDACRCEGTSSVQRRERQLAIPDNFSHRSLRIFCNDVGRLRAIGRNLERRTTACGSHAVRVEWSS